MFFFQRLSTAPVTPAAHSPGPFVILVPVAGALDATRALRLGFTADRHVDDVVREYMSEMIPGGTRA